MVSTAEQASQLVFCSAVFKETLRLWPAATALFLHSTVRRAGQHFCEGQMKEQTRVMPTAFRECSVAACDLNADMSAH